MNDRSEPNVSDHPLWVNAEALARADLTAPMFVSGLGRGLSLLEYGGAFWERARVVEEADDTALARAYDVLSGICRMRLDPDNAEVPLGSGPDDPLGPSFLPEQLPSETADILEGSAERIDDVWLRARIADVVHAARDRDHRAAGRAAEALGEAARASWSEERERAAATLVGRALQLTGPYGPKSEARRVAVEQWRALVDRAVEEEAEPADLNALLVLGLAYSVGGQEDLPALSEATAERAEGMGRWHLARQVWATTSDWWRLAKEPERAVDAQRRAAATYEREAERYLDGASDVPFSQAAPPLAKAVIAYRQVGDRERAGAAHRRLQEVQQGAAEEVARFGSATAQPISVEEMFNAGADAVRGLPLGDALAALIGLQRPSSPEERETEAKMELETYLGAQLFEDQLHTREGKLTARGRTLTDRAVKNEAFRMRIVGAGLLAGARRQLFEEYALGHVVLFTLLMHSPWVPDGRAGAYTRALLAGYRGDWEVMVALLCPQIEHSVRVLLHLGAGKSTSSLDDDGIQKEYGLSAVLGWPEAEAVLGADVAFALRVLLVHPWGPNLRNRSAHGLIDDGAIDGPSCEYLWWLAVRLCLSPPPSVRDARLGGPPAAAST